ncbi:hypothetical protein [Paenibacillus assamensis]|uniref:hypothetical protein n=1 Tax=Paenibacillus assamensis TaxID=311244 RepID=UPI00040012E0|nr:hypothetical protein [Paenibacillus assamensis]
MFGRKNSIMRELAQKMYDDYIEKRQDHTKLRDSYKIGEHLIEDLAEHLDIEKRISLYYMMAVHAYNLMHYKSSIDYASYITRVDDSNSPYKAGALYVLFSTFYQINDYQQCKKYLDLCLETGYDFAHKDAKIISLLLTIRENNSEAIQCLYTHIKNEENHNDSLVFIINELLQHSMHTNNYNLSKELCELETLVDKLVKTAPIEFQTPLLFATLAHFHNLKAEFLLTASSPNYEKVLRNYVSSFFNYYNHSHISKAFDILKKINNDILNNQPEVSNNSVRIMIQSLMDHLQRYDQKVGEHDNEEIYIKN